MPRELLYLIGVPGSGKTTLVRKALEGAPFAVVHEPFAHCIFGAGKVQLGIPRRLFGGTDALSMSVAPKVERALGERDWTHVLGEGDRLASYKFFDYVRNAAGWQLRVLWLDVPLDIARERRRARGSAQDDAWVAGRVTKVYRLGRRYDAELLDGRSALEALVERMRREPVVRALRGKEEGE